MEKVPSTTWQVASFGTEVAMTKYFMGIDIASNAFVAAVGTRPWKLVVKPHEFENAEDGFQAVWRWLQEHQLEPHQTLACLEATGVYGEGLAYFLVAKGYRVAVEPPLKVKRAFRPGGPKTDAVDSCQIAEYACRFEDELHFWRPPTELLEQIQVLLTTREQCSDQKTAHQNAWQAIRRKVVKTPLAEQVHQQAIAQLQDHIHGIDQELRRLIDSDPTFKQMLLLLLSVPGVGLLLASHLILLTQASLEPKELAAYLGIAPNEFSSGASVFKKASSRHYGPAPVRKLLYLASCSVRTHREQFRSYFLRKTAQGKPKRLVLNNIANKLLKIACAVLRSNTPFIPNYRPVQPLALTGSSYSQ
jgi:transposase